MFKSSKNQEGFYEIKLDREKKRHVFSELVNQVDNYPPKVSADQNSKPNRKLAISSAFKSLANRLAYSAAIFAVLFLILNWQSYSQILKVKVDEWRGEAKTSVLNELIDQELKVEDILEIPKIAPEAAKEAGAESTVKKFDIEKIVKPGGGKTNTVLPKLLKVSKNPELEKQNIPALDMEIRPPDTRLVIPRINRNVPIVQVRAENLLKREWDSLEKDMMEALRYGIVHFPGTAMPGEHGNIALTGHSSYFPWDPGRFKDVFALLHEVQMGDKILLYHKQTKYIYEVTDIKIVKPDDINVLDPTEDDRLTLITCTPIGTDLRRLVVTAKLIKEA